MTTTAWSANPKLDQRAPIRIHPIAGESVTSWIVRLAEVNGVAPRQLIWSMLPKHVGRDLELVPKAMVVRLAALTGTDLHTAESTTYSSMEGRLYSRDTASTWGPARWLSRRYRAGARIDPSYQICPLCLSSQEVPHYPLEWRIAAFSSCRTHRIILVDECPTCGDAIWPVPSGRKSRSKSSPGFLNCSTCGDDFRNAPALPTSIASFAFESYLYESLQAGYFTIKNSGTYYSVMLFEALYYIAQSFFWKYRQKQARSYVAEHLPDIGEWIPEESMRGAHLFATASAAVRHKLSAVFNALFANWPINLLNFYKAPMVRTVHYKKSELRSFDGRHVPFFLADAMASCYAPYSPCDAEMDNGLLWMAKHNKPVSYRDILALTGWPKHAVARAVERFERRFGRQSRNLEVSRLLQGSLQPWQVSQEEFDLIRPLLPLSHYSKTTRAPRYHIRDILDAIIYRSINQICWNDLPKGFPSAKAVRSRHLRLIQSGTMLKVLEILNEQRAEESRPMVPIFESGQKKRGHRTRPSRRRASTGLIGDGSCPVPDTTPGP